MPNTTIKKGEINRVTFGFQPNEEQPLGAHLAYTIAENGGAASGYNNALLFKGKAKLDEKGLSILKSLGVLKDENKDDTDSTVSVALVKEWYSSLRSKLREAIDEKEFFDEYDWICIEDFSEDKVVVYSDGSCYILDYTVTDGKVSVGDVASPVAEVTDWVVIEGKVKLSEQKEKELEQQYLDMVTKSVNSYEVQKGLNKILSKSNEAEQTTTQTKEDEGKPEMEAQANATQASQTENTDAIVKSAELEAILKQNKSMQEELNALKKAQQDAEIEKTVSVLKGFNVADDLTSTLATKMILDKELGESIVKALEAKDAELNELKKQFTVEKGFDGVNADKLNTTGDDLQDRIAQAVLKAKEAQAK